MSKIDDIFKDGLDGKGMPYEDAHWQKMEELIPAKPPFNWWKAGIAGTTVAVIGLSIFLVGYLKQDTEQFSSSTKVSQTEAKSEISPIDNQTEAFHHSKKVKEKKISAGSVLEKEAKKDNVFYDHVLAASVGVESEPQVPVHSISDQRQSEDAGYMVGASNSTASNSAIEQDGFVNRVSNDNGLLRPIKMRGISLLVLDDSKSTEEERLNKKSLMKSPFEPKWEFYISPFIELAASNAIKDLPGGYTDELGNLNQKDAMSAMNYGLSLKVKKGKWSIGTAILLTSLNERTNFTQATTSYQYQTAYRLVDSDFSTTSRGTRVILIEEVIVDSTVVTDENVICKDCQNELTYLEIPLFARYDVNLSRLTLFGEVGGSLAFLRKNSGDFALLSEQGKTIEVRQTNDGDLRSMIPFVSLNAGVAYQISARISAWSSIGIRTSNQSAFVGFEQQTSLSSFRLGLQYRLR